MIDHLTFERGACGHLVQRGLPCLECEPYAYRQTRWTGGYVPLQIPIERSGLQGMLYVCCWTRGDADVVGARLRAELAP